VNTLGWSFEPGCVQALPGDSNGRPGSTPAAQQTGLVVARLFIITLGIIIVVGGDPQEAVSFALCVTVVSRDCSRRIDGARPSACGAGGIE
jgi:hypothetical protein